jgi:hypothetical protein
MNSLRPLPFHPPLTILPLALCAALAACQPASEDEAPADSAANEATLNLPSVPRPEPPLDRAGILTAVAQAASATAAGIEDSAAHRSLDGKPFEFRIRFGCRGPSPDLREAMFGWTLDQESGTLRVRATPTISAGQGIVQRVAGEEFEAAEGFWVPRPWLLESACPAAAAVRPAPTKAQAAPAAAGPAAKKGRDVPAPVEDEQETESPPPAWPKVGIAQFFRDTDPRTGRRGTQPYETVKTLDLEQPISSQGFNLVISGRLRALPGQRVIACVSRGADAPPDCIVSARIDRVRLERPDTEEILAEWGGS